MVHSILNEKSSLNVPAILKAEQEYHEAKALASKQRFVAGGGVFPTGVGSKSGPVIQPSASTASGRKSQLLADIDKIRRDIQEVLSNDIDSIDKLPAALDKLNAVDSEVKELRNEIQQFSKDVLSALSKLGARLESLSVTASTAVSSAQKPTEQPSKAAPKASAAAKPQKEDDDIDLFGSDDEEVDPEAEKLRHERLSAYDQKKAKKPTLIAKSMIILDVKPWDDETDVQEMERKVRSIEADGLVWGTSKFVEVAYGIKKLQITCVVEDEKISTDFLEEQITGFEELVQSIDIVAFNKI